MHHDAANPDGIGRMSHAARPIAEHGTPKALSLKSSVDGETGQYNDWNRVGHIPPESSRSASHSERSGSKRIVPYHPLSFTDNVSTRSAARLVGARSTLQPIVKRCLTRREILDLMMTCKRRQRRE
jgi:hypothetical protein